MKITIHFNIEYFTRPGENLYVSGTISELGRQDPVEAVRMTYHPGGQWKLDIELPKKPSAPLAYKYFLKDDQDPDRLHWEWGQDREIDFNDFSHQHFHVRDAWRPSRNLENVFFSSAFTANLMKRPGVRLRGSHKKFFNQRFQLYAPRVSSDLYFCVSGSDPGLGEWDPEKAQIMDDSDYPLWKTDVLLESDQRPVFYKYGIYDKKEKKLIAWEYGENRMVRDPHNLFDNYLTIRTDQSFRYTQGAWKGAGLAMPIFSIRTQQSWGIGEFGDVTLLVDWAVKCGLKIIQILPINDTIASHTWMDSYPYAAISVYAFHPMYLHCPSIGDLADEKEMSDFRKKAKALNDRPEIDYLEVMKLKSRFYKKIYDQERDKFLEDPGFKEFFRENKYWLVPYAVFSCLRDRFGTSDFTQWGRYSVYNEQELSPLTDPAGRDYDDIAVHYFIQYHLHKQLSAVAEYARYKGVVLKGDIPIGIFRNSVDAWINPAIYHMDKQAGAPPDAYSVTGQNWKFPTYNWEQMAEDKYAWWRSRLTYMSRYFDAYRIDHILGFFRIWEIPLDAVEGLMGKFNPVIPMYRHELESTGLFFDQARFCEPWIREYMLDEIFGPYKNEVIEKHLVHKDGDRFELKEGSHTQKQIEMLYSTLHDEDGKEIERKEKIRDGMFQLIANLLFFEETGSGGNAFHPRIAFHQTLSYREFDDHTKNILNGIYTHYFYHRQENFWRGQALVKLPVITGASNMLVCGEDLGMVPDCVPGVMDELNILRLYIQRMPKAGWNEFGHPADAPYLSVSSPSCHDMSSVRGWWEEDHERAQRFFNQILAQTGEAPHKCDTWISEEIVKQHFYSPSMWAIFPIQDLLGMDDELRSEDPEKDQINDPANPRNLWKYRMHVYVEDMMENKGFNARLLDLVLMSGRKNRI